MTNFQRECGIALASLQRSIQRVLGEVGVSTPRPNSVSQTLSLERNLSWKIGRVLEERDPLSILRYMPGSAAFESFLSAATRQGARPEAIGSAREALKGVERLINEHAGDRESLEIMVSGFADPTGTGHTAIAQRKAAFQGNSAILGIQAKTLYRMLVIAPSATAGMADALTIRGADSLRWMRPGRWTVGTTWIRESETSGVIQAGVSPLTPGITPGKTPLLEEFSSRPTPTIEQVEFSADLRLEQLVSDEVGTASAVTFMIGDYLKGKLPCYYTPSEPTGVWILRVLMPCEVVVFDCFLHRDVRTESSPSAGMYTELVAGHYPVCEHARLPIATVVERMGQGASAALPRDILRLPDMSLFAFEKMGWRDKEFTLFRVRVEYPPIASDIVMSWDLPAGPGC